jgi:hypothetical protein
MPETSLPSGLTVSTLRSYLDEQSFDVEDDPNEELLQGFLLAAFAQAAEAPPYGCGRVLVPDPADDASTVTRRRLSRGSRFVRVPDARAITEVKVDGTATESFETLERNGLIVRLELACRGSEVVEITGRFGYLELPWLLSDAIYVLAARYWMERQSRFTDGLQFHDGAPMQRLRLLPNRTKMVFQSFTVPAAVGGLR